MNILLILQISELHENFIKSDTYFYLTKIEKSKYKYCKK
uniref:Uncharacterized protein n=1 Tax=viral metagenome TaxID=1070528 RepID=A0A6C0HLF8_9ZZZZ